MMKRLSIRKKFFIAIGLVAVVFLAVMTLLNTFAFGYYYHYTKLHDLVKIFGKVNGAYQGDPAEVSEILAWAENAYGMRISIDNGGDIVYDTVFQIKRNEHALRQAGTENGKPPEPGQEPEKNPGHMPDEMPPEEGGQQSPPPPESETEQGRPSGRGRLAPWEMQRLIYDENELEKRGYTFTFLKDEGLGVEFMSLIGKLNNGDRITVRVPVSFMEETSRLIAVFFTIAGICSLIVCIAVAFFLSKYFSVPLVQMRDVADAVARLDFTKAYTGDSQDEMGDLGRSINQMSQYLKNAIEDLKQINVQLAAEIEKKEQIDAMRKEFIINVSHELKTPIALVQGYAEGLRININSSEEDKNYYCDVIIDESKRMNKMVMQLLALSKIELGNVTPECSEILLTELCGRIVEKVKKLSEEKGLTFDVSGLTGTEIWADYDMIEKVITNLLTNAADHTPKGGTIRLKAYLKDAKTVCEVFNSGNGIEEAELSKIWDKFYKLDKARVRVSGGGTGIGLSIVRAMVEAHKGKCGARNVKGGIVFWFELPGKPKEEKTE